MKTIATDDQKILQSFAPADADKVPVGPDGATVTVAFQDLTGTDVTKWITATPDPKTPFGFIYTRVPNDGTQPDELDFVAVGTSTINGVTITATSDPFSFVPGAVATLTASAPVVESEAPPAPPAVGATIPVAVDPANPTGPSVVHTVTALNPDGSVTAQPAGGGAPVTLDPATLPPATTASASGAAGS